MFPITSHLLVEEVCFSTEQLPFQGSSSFALTTNNVLHLQFSLNDLWTFLSIIIWKAQGVPQ